MPETRTVFFEVLSNTRSSVAVAEKNPLPRGWVTACSVPSGVNARLQVTENSPLLVGVT